MPKVIDSFSKEYAFLSNFERAGLLYDGDIYQSSEAAYQAAKLPQRRERIAFVGFNCLPWKAKRMGRNLPSFSIRKDWHEVKDQVMLDVIRAKFANGVLREKLLNTGDAFLVEGNIHHDNYWGVCKCLTTPFEERKYGTKEGCNGTGLNRLGQLLMQVRDELRLQGRARQLEGAGSLAVLAVS